MAEQTRAVFLKQSGERLAKGKGGFAAWQPDGVRAIGEKIAHVYAQRQQLQIDGFTIVSGAGNIARGEQLRGEGIAPKYADIIGRGATILNTLVIADTLERLKVPVAIFLAESMNYRDGDFDLPTYSVEDVRAAHEQGQVVLIAGGTGEDNVTTDHAVVAYAAAYRQVYDGVVTILKGTQVDGVYDDDPHKKANAQRYQKISAGFMLENYKRFGVVDKSSLEKLVESGLSMLVYAEGAHDLETVLRHSLPGQRHLGTLIAPEDQEPVLY